MASMALLFHQISGLARLHLDGIDGRNMGLRWLMRYSDSWAEKYRRPRCVASKLIIQEILFFSGLSYNIYKLCQAFLSPRTFS
jgi:hypothetical protein